MGRTLSKPRIHVDPEFAELLPGLSREEFEALRADIRANGVQEKIVLDDTGAILDGHHRFRIDRDAPTRILAGAAEMTRAEKKAYVIRSNLARRNLSDEQRVALLPRQRAIALELNQNHTDQEIGRMIRVARRTVTRWIQESGTNGHAAKGSKAAAKRGDNGSNGKPRVDHRRKTEGGLAAAVSDKHVAAVPHNGRAKLGGLQRHGGRARPEAKG